MDIQLISRYRSKLQSTSTDFVRYLHDLISWDAQLVAIVGARGVGKTTLILQHIKMYDDAKTSLYVSADDIYFASHTLVGLAEDFYKNGGKRLYIDEIHRYTNWSTEIKNIYDFLPGLHVVYTGSSILDLEKGGADLSRRRLQYHLYGLSFREYLALAEEIKLPVASLEDVISGKVLFPADYRPVQYFKRYLQHGYYPFFRQEEFLTRLDQTINATLDTDIPQFASLNLSTIKKIKLLLYIIAGSVPFKPNISKIARDTSIGRNDLPNVFEYLDKAGLIEQLRSDVNGISALGKVDKVYLDNTNLAYALSPSDPDVGNLRETFFMMATRVTLDPVLSEQSDFKLGKYTFEVGGRNKSGKQIKDLSNAYVVKDDIEFPVNNTLPLWTFGFLY